MSKELNVEKFFSSDGEGLVLSDYGVEGTGLLLDTYSGGQIKQIGDVSRSALINYKTRANRISKRGKQALENLIARYNVDIIGGESKEGLDCFTDRQLLEELTKRGYTLFIKYESHR